MYGDAWFSRGGNTAMQPLHTSASIARALLDKRCAGEEDQNLRLVGLS